MKRISSITLVFITFCLTITAGYWYALAPRVQTISKNFATIELLDEQSKDVASSLLSRGKQQLLVDKVVSEREAIVGPLLPQEDNIYDLSIQIESWAKNSGVALSSINIQNPVGAGGLPPTTSAQSKSASTIQVPAGIRQVPILLSVTGSYTSIKQFTAGLSQLSRAIQVLEVTFTGSGSSQTAQLTATAFTYAPK